MKTSIATVANAILSVASVVNAASPNVYTSSVSERKGSNPPPSHTRANLEISIENRMDDEITLSFVKGADPIIPDIIGHDCNTPASLPAGKTIVLEVPYLWVGNIRTSNATVYSSIIEGSRARAGDWLDVSYVEGFTVPITCSFVESSANRRRSPSVGCNYDLFEMNNCPDEQTVTANHITTRFCKNPANINPGNGPATQFFAPCQGAAYTFPKDDKASQGFHGNARCCIGKSCPATNRQHKVDAIASKI